MLLITYSRVVAWRRRWAAILMGVQRSSFSWILKNEEEVTRRKESGKGEAFCAKDVKAVSIQKQIS